MIGFGLVGFGLVGFGWSGNIENRKKLTGPHRWTDRHEQFLELLRN